MTLTCTIQLDTTLVNMLGDLSVSSTWTTPSGTALASTSRITVSETSHISGTTYSSRVVFDTVHASDTGDYTCQVSVSLRTPSVFVTQGEGSDTVRVTVQCKVYCMFILYDITPKCNSIARKLCIERMP